MTNEYKISAAMVQEAYVSVPKNSSIHEVLTLLLQSLVDAGKISDEHTDELIKIAMIREDSGSTGIGRGIAIPHCRSDLVDSVVCAFGHSEHGVIFDDGLDTSPVHSIFFLISPQTVHQEHLAFMRSLAQHMRTTLFCDTLHTITDADSLMRTLTTFETEAHAENEMNRI